MLRIISLLLLLGLSVVIFACQSSTNSNNSTNSTRNANTQQMPPGISSSPITPSTNTAPGIPANIVNAVPKGATPTPGIPDPRLANRKVKPGATPTPGIPDPETLRRQMQGQEKPNVNLAAPGDMMMMKKKKPVNKPD